MHGIENSSIQDYLNVAGLARRTGALGPGVRGVVWVQGCPLYCPGCISPSWIPFEEASLYTPTEILQILDFHSLDGLTFSGGEPMEQAGGLASLARLARNLKDINIICFTGYRYDRLIKDPPNPGVPELLSELDVLIDGPYIQEKNNSIGLRGSTNQRFIHLTSRFRDIEFETQSRRVELYVSDGELQLIGIPTPEMKLAFDQAIKAGMERIGLS